MHLKKKKKSSSSSCPIAMASFLSFFPLNHWSEDLICLSSCAKRLRCCKEGGRKVQAPETLSEKRHPCASLVQLCLGFFVYVCV